MSTGYNISQNLHTLGGLGVNSSQYASGNTDLTSLRGQTVVITKDPSSLLLDAQEEIASMRAGDKSLERRKPCRSLGTTALGVELAKQYIARGEISDVLEGGSVLGIVKRLKDVQRKKGIASDAGSELKNILDSLDDGLVHKRFAILIGLQNTSGESSSNHQQTLLQAELEYMYAEQGTAIRAGFNTDGIVKNHSELDHQRGLMSLYLTMVVDGPPLSEIYRGTVEKYGRNRFSEVMQFLLGAAGKDIKSLASSKEPSALRFAVANLRKFQVLRTIENACHSAIDVLQNALKPGVVGVDIFSSVLTLVETKWPLPETVSKEYLKLSKQTPQANVWMHNALYNVIETVPLTVFKDDAARTVLMTALSDARSLVTEEEELEEIDIKPSTENGRGST